MIIVMLKNGWKYTAAIFTIFAIVGELNLPFFSSVKVFAQTPPDAQCTDVKIKLYIWQLQQGSPSVFNALVDCNSKAVPALTRALDSEDNNVRIIAIAALGEIGTNAASAEPKLRGLLRDKNDDVRAITNDALSKITEEEEELASGTTFIRGTINTDKVKPLVICRIPVISNVLKWKCPKKDIRKDKKPQSDQQQNSVNSSTTSPGSQKTK
ncbi:MAG: HEAT repeat domain-containing protein [Calothrix sp. MO_167.B42]|nr:HEAT repeat domain-containing protein [Calothrix sp. MO_167.B42]